MTEKIIAPDVYTTETDKSYISPGIPSVGLAVVGPTEKGEAFVPTDVYSYNNYVSIFGSNSSDTYVPHSVINYLQSGNSVKVTRVLGNGGWSFDGTTKKLVALTTPSQSAVNGTTSSINITTASLKEFNRYYGQIVKGAPYTLFRYLNLIGNSNSYYFQRKDLYDNVNIGAIGTNVITYLSGSTVNGTYQNLINAINISSSLYSTTASFTADSSSIFLRSTITGSITNSNYYYYIVDQYLDEETGGDFSGGSDAIPAITPKLLTIFHPSKNNNADIATQNSSSATGTNSNFNLTLRGTQINKVVSASLDKTNVNYITKVLGNDENFEKNSSYPYLNFNNFYTNNISGANTISMSFNTNPVTFTSSYSSGYDNAKTPWIISETGNRLFRFQHKSHGTKTNRDIKISISDIVKSSDVDTYSTFNILVRKWNDTDRQPSILEQYMNVTLDPNSASYIGKVIGDKYNEYDENQGKVIKHGDYTNVSNLIRVEISTSVEQASINANTIPNGFESVMETIAGFSGATLPTASMLTSNSSSYFFSGFDYSNTDNINYLNPIPLEALVGENINFSKPSNDNKFTIPLQGGTDGMNFATVRNVGSDISTNGTNVFGFNLSTDSTGGTNAYRKALDILSNTKEYKFNILTLPGIIDEYHTSVTSLAETMVEGRSDAIYIRDLTGIDSSITTAVTIASGIDSSYSAAYYPWVKIKGLSTPKDIYVPTSVVIPQTIAYTDKTRGPWYAPAGLTQGALSGVIDTRVVINRSDIETLYAGKVNPLVRESGFGIIAMGQKTLQLANTSLTRINVRRLLIELKTYISNVSKQLIFEQNTTVTRNRFINMVDPYLSSIQQKQGLYAYRIYMDDTNNTADIIDRNQLVGQIELYPAKSVEYIILDFSINPTSGIATF